MHRVQSVTTAPKFYKLFEYLLTPALKIMVFLLFIPSVLHLYYRRPFFTYQFSLLLKQQPQFIKALYYHLVQLDLRFIPKYFTIFVKVQFHLFLFLKLHKSFSQMEVWYKELYQLKNQSYNGLLKEVSLNCYHKLLKQLLQFKR